MRTWDGLPGLLANLPGVGATFAKLINRVMLRKNRLYAWPNLWAGEAIVPELLGQLQPVEVANIALSWLENPEELEAIRQRLRSVRGEAGAVEKLTEIVAELATP
jgi:lipid-A-disaccharide synthase